MSKVAKTVKSLRNEKNLSQDSLAQQLFVSRQTVSSWENGRTQPDIDMLIKLSEVFGVSVEEIIYGKKRNVGLEADKSQSRRTLTVILAALGSLFTAVGLILLFVYLWEEFPESVKGLFGFIPLLVGISAGLFVYFKKNNSALWRESGAVVWVAGIAATNALINSIYAADMGFANLLLIDAVLILPIMFILDAVSPLTVSAVLAVAYPACVWGETSEYFGIPVGLALLAVSAVFIIRDFKSKSHRRYTVWLGISAGAAMLCVITSIISKEPLLSTLIIALSTLVAMLNADTENGFPYPFKYPAVIGISAVTTAFTALFLVDGGFYYISISKSSLIPTIVAGAAIILAGTAYGIKALLSNPLKIAFSALSVSYIICLVAAAMLNADLSFIFILLVCALGTVILISGIKSARLLTVNLGLLMIMAMLWLILAGLELKLAGIGAAFAGTGIVLLVINKIMMTRLKKQTTGEEDESNA